MLRMERKRITWMLSSLCILLATESLKAVVAQGATRPEEPSTCDCTDNSPPESTCAQQMKWGKCEADWMKSGGFCEVTCGRCQCKRPSEALKSRAVISSSETPCTCTDILPPKSPFACQDQKERGKCGADWMVVTRASPQGYCALTCGACVCTSSVGNEAMVPTVEPTVEDPQSIPEPAPEPTPEPAPEPMPKPVPEPESEATVEQAGAKEPSESGAPIPTPVDEPREGEESTEQGSLESDTRSQDSSPEVESPIDLSPELEDLVDTLTDVFGTDEESNNFADLQTDVSGEAPDLLPISFNLSSAAGVSWKFCVLNAGQEGSGNTTGGQASSVLGPPLETPALLDTGGSRKLLQVVSWKSTTRRQDTSGPTVKILHIGTGDNAKLPPVFTPIWSPEKIKSIKDSVVQFIEQGFKIEQT